MLKEGNLSTVFDALTHNASLTEAYLVAESEASATIFRRAKTLINGRAADDDSVHQRFEAFSDDLKRKVLSEIPALANAMRLFIEYRAPNADLSAFDSVLDTTALLRAVVD